MAADDCGRCGASTVPGARFCHACGVRLGVAVVEFDFFGQSPSEGSLVESAGSPPSRLSVLAGLAAVLALAGLGLFAVGWDSNSEDAADSEPSDTGSDESVGDEAVADVVAPSEPESVLSVVDDDQLIWQAGPELGGAWPIAVVEHDGASLLFASTEIPFYGSPSVGLVLWRLDSEGVWASLGTVIDPANKITAVTSTAGSIVAVGRGTDGAPSVWSSNDGIEWARQALPLTASSPLVLPTHVVATEAVTVIVGAVSTGEGYSTFGQAVEEYTGLRQGQAGLQWHQSRTNVTILGPFGITLSEIDVSELGLSEAEIARAFSPGGRDGSVVWSSADGAGWEMTPLSSSWPAGIVWTAAGEFLIAGSGSGGGRIWKSADGAAWDESAGPEIGSLARWQDKVVGVRGDGTGYLAVSATGTDWASIPLPEILPSGHNWWPSQVTADKDGIAVAAQGWRTSSEQRRPATAALLKDGYELVAEDGHQLTLRADGQELVQLWTGASLGQGGYEPDLAAGTVTIVDRETGERYLEFTLDELRQLESMANDGMFDTDRNALILHSVDAETWRMSALSELGGQSEPFQSMALLQMANSQLVAAVTTHGEGGPWNSSEVTVEVFTAPLP